MVVSRLSGFSARKKHVIFKKENDVLFEWLLSVSAWIGAHAAPSGIARRIRQGLGLQSSSNPPARLYLCCIAAFTVLTKGPIGLFLPGLAALLFLAYNKDLEEMKHVHLFSGLTLFAVITGAW